jgi:hypothetical protein
MSRLAALPLILVFATASAVAIPTRGEDAKPAAGPDLSGRWVYNVSLSDDAREKMREARGGGSGGGGGGYGGGGGGGYGGHGGYGGGLGGRGGRGYGGGYGHHGGGGGGGRSGSSTPSDSDLKQGKSSVLNPPLELKVVQTESEIDVDDMVGKVRKLFPNGKKYKADDSDAEVKSSWHDGKLQVETKKSHGSTVTETWERVPDGSRLIVHLKVEGSFGKLELKRIYDREAPDTKTAS